ncbi:glycosyltransferase [Paracoccus gahaiensis]|uniref:Glycosyltransferase n=1 Tax=Paracoccus gahaiensis TaxID=1706839 RepID=A0A4U0RC54_9RHOB|nr:glycosyltransferase [Paracoccus gahaiensis]TJZ92893.1 glycosyltransferase [Paracoccus gahaiensis]
MKILFVHQNFPGQFPHLAPALVARGHQVLALTDETNKRPSPVKTLRYKSPEPAVMESALGRSYTDHAERGFLVARGARVLRDKHGFQPDIIIGHPGWGETLFLKEIWPQATLLIYAELMYRTRGQDVGFDHEMGPDRDETRFMTVSRSAHLIQAMVQADGAIAPTRYQADSFPPELRGKITVIHDGVSTETVAPDPQAMLALPQGGPVLRAGDEVLSFVSRSLEPYRGFHAFMRALPAVMAARPQAQVVMVGSDDPSYGGKPRDATSWRAKLLAELDGQLDLGRLHFLGRVPYADYLSLIKLTRVHCYLTYPFVLSWSLMEAMAAGAYVVGSDTEPVREMIEDGRNGRLVPFFDTAALAGALERGLAGDPDGPALKRAARQTILDGYDLLRDCLPRQIAWVESRGALR